MIQSIKKPIVIIALASALIAALGSLLGWFGIGNDLVRGIAEAELQKKETLSLIITLLCTGISILSIAIKKHRLAFIVLPIALYGLVLVINQKPDADIAETIDLSIGVGYWMSIVGTLAMIVSNAIIGIRGVKISESTQEKKES